MKIRGFLEDSQPKLRKILCDFVYIRDLVAPSDAIAWAGDCLLPEADSISTRFGCFVHNQKVCIITMNEREVGSETLVRSGRLG